MATIINTPGNTESSDGAGWAVAVIILLAVIGVGGYYLLHHRGAAPTSGANINVSIPTPSVNSTQ